MWACARGHQDAAVILYEWNPDALALKNHSKQTAVDIAIENG